MNVMIKACREGKRMLFLLGMLALPLFVFCQERAKIVMSADIQRRASRLKDVDVLYGNVRFRHGSIVMYCDSAYYYMDKQALDAYGEVHIISGDTLHLYSDKLYYLGAEHLAQMRENVRMVNRDVVLTTQKLDYDQLNNVAYYFDGGRIDHGQNILTSKVGRYYPDRNEAFFKDSVVVVNPEYTIRADTMKYHTETEIVYFYGATHIESEGQYLYSEKGWYDTMHDFAELNKNSFISYEKQVLRGDTLLYDRVRGLGEALHFMELEDTTQHVILRGGYGIFNQNSQEALLTQKAVMIQYEKTDSLFLHADTLVSLRDSSRQYNVLKAFHGVRFFRDDFQGKCDSLVYSTQDSIISMFIDPVLWSDNNQLSAEEIRLYSKDQKMDRVEMDKNSFIISREDSVRYDQIKGRNMVGHLKDNQLRVIDVMGNGQSIYYPKDKDVIMGANRAESSNMKIYFKDRKVFRIGLLNEPKGVLHPPLEILPEEAILKDFKWLGDLKPTSKTDIFRFYAPSEATIKSYLKTLYHPFCTDSISGGEVGKLQNIKP